MRGGYAATPQRSAKAKTGALDQAMVGLQAAERAITELQGVIAVRCQMELCTYMVTNTRRSWHTVFSLSRPYVQAGHNHKLETPQQVLRQLTSKRINANSPACATAPP